jgi:hypothetical protein
VVLAAAPLLPGERRPAPERYGIYLAGQDWLAAGEGEAGPPRLLFDDPALVDAEPVAVYVRPMPPQPGPLAPGLVAPPERKLELAGGRYHEGEAGFTSSATLFIVQNEHKPGQRTDAGQGPIFDAPPSGAFASLRFYASHRDRFDDPVRERVPGGWELLREAPLKGGTFSAALPARVPFVLAAFDSTGRIGRWTTAARDARGRQATFFAFAGDHYSATKPGRYEFCVGCHPGHSNPGFQQQGERLR